MSAGLLAVLASVVEARADAPAIDDRGRVYSYAQLWDWAAAVAEYLAGQGVGRGSRVTLELGKSAEVVAAMLGCWWVGAAFIPLPPELPSERRRVIVDEVRPALRVQGELIASLREGRGGRPPEALPVALEPEDLAYILYTSGSSGRPKGVMVPHRGIVALLEAQCRVFGLGPGSRCLAYLSLAFDASISDLGTALYAGGTVVIAEPARISTPEGLLAVLRDQAIHYADLPPALLGHLDPTCLPRTLATLVIGGEVCPPSVVRRYAERVRLVNVYGPTEATVCASTIVCDPQWDRARIGAPLPGWEFVVVDDEGVEVEADGPGELWIGGVGLAHGYVARIDGSDPDPGRFTTFAGRPMFRTGDRVRRCDEGGYEFLGRLDRQRKIGGVRIELDELEVWLSEHPGVQEAAVVEGRDGRLVGHYAVVAAAQREPDSDQLRRHLGARVPAAAIPRRFVRHPMLPRGPTGKLDRGRLVDWEDPGVGASDGGDEPGADPLAGILIGLWRHILGLGPTADVDVQAGFCTLGGGSLAALELVAAASPYGLTLSAAALLADQCFAELLITARDSVDDARTTTSLVRAVDAAIARAGLEPGLEQGLERGPPRSSAATRELGLEPGATLLITGATGFLGRRLVVELRRRHRGPMLALVRGRDQAHAQARLDRALGEAAGTVEAVLGDLGAPRLGLDGHSWTRLAEQVHGIVHAGAEVHLGFGFERLRPVNLDACAEVVRLAEAGRAKQLHHISTLSVFVAATPAIPEPHEHDELLGAEGSSTRIHGGYAQSKWAAEQLVRTRSRRGLAVAIHRLGLITGDLVHGRGPANDQLGLVVRGLVELGAIPAGHEPLRVDMTPVCHAARSLAALILDGPPLRVGAPTTYHLASARGATAADLLAAIRRSGAVVEVVDAATWAALGRTLSSRSAAAAVAYLALGRCLGRCLGLEGPSFNRLRGYDLFQATGFRFDDRRAAAILEPRGLVCPVASEALLDRYVAAARRPE